MKEFRPALLFLVKFLGIYILGNIVYGLYINHYYPQSDPATRWISNQVSMIISDKDKELNSAIHLKKNKNRRGSNQKKAGMKKQKDLSVPRRQEYCDSDDFKQDSKIPVVNPNKYKPFDFKRVERLGLKTQECHSMLSFSKYSPKGLLFDKMERGRIKITVGLVLI